VLSSYDLYYLYSGILMLGISSIGFIQHTVFMAKHEPSSLLNPSLTPSIHWKTLIVSLCIGGVSYLSHMTVCNTIAFGSTLCTTSMLPLVLVSIACISTCIYFIITASFYTIWTIQIHTWTPDRTILILGSLLHLISLSSTRHNVYI
jgi:hypothetical protein